MQLTAETIAIYEAQAPELLDAVTKDDSGFVMKRDVVTSNCVKFEQGLCAIQRNYGAAMLGDACYFFPRITRALGTSLLTTMTLACPEAARLMLYEQDSFVLGERKEVRTPYSLRNYMPKELDESAALTIHSLFMDIAGDESVPAARSILRISAIARALEMQPLSSWLEAIPFYASIADGRLPAPQPAATDLFNLTHALHGLVKASEAQGTQLMRIVGDMAHMLGMDFAPAGGIVLADDAAERALVALSRIRQQSQLLQAVLRRYLQAQISGAFFPFSGLGHTLSERITIIGVRFATLRLALATLGADPSSGEVIRIVQTLSRFSDHLADPALSLQIYRETGWVRESRLCAIIGE